ncbi:N-acetyltransferase [Corynebacterium testudinoris]|uniref:Putative acetyltransferase n=1 Tax=Corynebacterium testudinoris TaxID=136857 RepID=A0A0G3HET0_9CORY|nr:GNAT family N-acetyltransferase [Corynebacterium testudinoris]AKK09627.1 putative acetyltransferase [Corynebacterium testudinoris]MBX8996367.1 N-acetyltransferase [Corynebacterium testudinoris]
MSETQHSVEHNEAKHRYEIRVDGREAGYAAYVPRPGGVLDFNHTVVDQAFRGRGLSTPLIKAALDDVRAAGGTVRPSCSAVQHFIAKHEEYRDLVA